jgi:hypothetical protein
MTDWCILRTKPSATLRLAASLAEDGILAWTPAEVRRNRRPRRNVQDPEPCPIMPTFVFADALRLVDLLDLADMPVKPRRGQYLHEPAHEDFSVFHHYDRIPVVAEAALFHLREEERGADARYQRTLARAMAKTKGEPYDDGDEIRLPNGPFAGLSGQVVESDGKFTLICFGRTRVKISTFILRSDMADRLQAATGSELKAA